jgi:NAD(P)-dependent dehydrogenase (short-subunit alcohol dehydrogenase family)
MMGRLEGKVALVTGAASGIGKAAALLFAEEGAAVVAADINEASLAKLQSEGPAKLATAQLDVTSPESFETVVRDIVRNYGRIDVLYNNAGGSSVRDGTAVDVDLDEFWRSIKLDLYGTFLGCRFAIPHMIAGGGGSIINTTSNVALMGVPGVDCYTAAKGGVAALTRSLAVEYSSSRVRVNAIAPSTTLSPRVVERLQVSEGMRELAAKNLLGNAAPLDIAFAALYLASEESRMTTGAILLADSGTTIS